MPADTIERSAWPAEAPSRSLTGLWREARGLDCLVILGLEPVTPGMVIVARAGEDWANRPALRWQAWPEDLEPH